MMSAGAGAARATGSSQRIANSAAPTVGAPVLAQRCGRCGTERSAEFGRVNHALCRHAPRARLSPIPARSDADRPAPAGSAALRPSSIVARNRKSLEWNRRPAPIVRPAAGSMMSAGAGAARATGSSQQIGNSAALTVGALSLARSALRPLRLGKISRIWPI